MDDAVVLFELLRHLRRAVLGEIGGRGARHQARGAEAPRDQARIAEIAKLDGEVEAVVDQIDEIVAEDQRDANVGIAFREGVDDRRDM